MLYEDLTMPDDVRDALVDDINNLPLEPFKDILEHDSDFARGFRPDPKNLATFRKKLVERLLHPKRPLEGGEIWAIRAYGFNMKFVCVFSTRALTDFFDPLAEFIGGAKLLAGMLVDRRKKVVEWAKARAADGKPLPPPPADPEAAKTAIRRCFTPFLDTMSAALVAPVVKKVVKEEKPAAPVPDEAFLREVAKKLKRLARTQAELAEANRRIMELVREGVRKDEALAAIKKERNAALEAARDAKREAKVAKRAIRRATPGVEAAEEAQAEAEKRAKEAQKRAQAAEEALAAAVARAERAEAALAARADAVAEPEPEVQAPEEAIEPSVEPEAPAPTEPLDPKHAAFEAMLNEAEPIRPAYQNLPEMLLSRVFHGHYSHDDALIFLIDGHNILNLGWLELSKERQNGLTHREVREAFVEKCKRIALGFPNSRTVVFFDGEVARQVPVTPNLVVEYSGNPEHIPEHRADRIIVGYTNYLHTQEKVDPWSVIVVSADQGLCADARIAGAMTIHHHRLFLELLAACR